MRHRRRLPARTALRSHVTFAPSDLSSASIAGIALRTDAVGQHLHRHMAVAEMPGEPRQRGHVGGARLDQRLGRGHDLDQRAVVEQQRIVGAQPHRLCEIDLEAAAFDAGRRSLLRAALGVIENDGVDDAAAWRSAGVKDAGGARHRFQACRAVVQPAGARTEPPGGRAARRRRAPQASRRGGRASLRW